MIPADIARAIRDRDRVAMARPHPTTAPLDRHDLIVEVDRLNRELDRLTREADIMRAHLSGPVTP